MGQPHIRKRVICAAAALMLTSLSATVFVSAEPRNLESRAVRAIKVDQAMIDRGRYIIRTAGCNDCHTPGYGLNGGAVDESNWLTGDRLGWEGPWGTTYAINLRQFMQDLTLDQWLQIAGRPVRPPMPWFSLRDMSDDDLTAIYYYVRSLGAAGPAAPAYVPPGQTAQTPVVKFPVG